MGEMQGGQKVRVLLAQALFGSPQALLLDEPTNHLDLDSIHWLREFLVRYDGTLIVISHDRHFLNSVCTHIADIDYQTIITYTGGYDDMVMAKTQIRGQVEAQNAQREKKIAQLNDFIARFSAGTRSSQVQSRRKEVERLQTTELARSNIQRPYIKFAMNRPVGPDGARVQPAVEELRRPAGHRRLQRDRQSRREDRHRRPQRRGQDDAAEGADVGRARIGRRHRRPRLRARSRWGHEASIGYFPQDHAGQIAQGHDRGRVAASVRSRRRRARTSTACSARCSSAAKKG